MQSGRFSTQKGIKSERRTGKWVIVGPPRDCRHRIEEEQPETYTDMKGETWGAWQFEVTKSSLWDNVNLLKEHLKGRDGGNKDEM